MDDFQPNLRPKERRNSNINGPDWLPVEDTLPASVWHSETRLKKAIRERLLERWSEHPLVKNLLKLVKLREKMIELQEEMLMAVLHRLDRGLPLRSEKKQGD